MKQKQRLFECIVLGHKNNGTDENPNWETEVRLDERILATTQDDVRFKLTRMISDDDVEKYGVDGLEIFIRSFS